MSIRKPVANGVTYSQDELKIFAATYEISKSVLLFGLAGVAAIALWAWGAVTPPDHAGLLSRFGVDLLVGGAAAAVGALLGFVFGIPRSLEPASRAAAAVVAANAGDPAASRAAMGVNTNLERISDWLTTLLVGATLVQIKPIIEWIGELGGKFFKPGTTSPNDAIVPVIIVLFFCLSFLGIYLITRLYLTSALSLT